MLQTYIYIAVRDFYSLQPQLGSAQHMSDIYYAML